MDYLMLRTFDQAGYAETRLILTIISFLIAFYFLYYKSDRRFLLIFGSGVLLHTLMEFWLKWRGTPGAELPMLLFGARIPGALAPLLRGFFEGGVVSLFAFWFADLRSSNALWKDRRWFGGLCVTVVLLSLICGLAARRHFVTSARPIFDSPPIFVTTAIIFVCLMIAWRKDDISSLAGFFAGLLVFAFLNFEPMHLLGVRYIGAVSSETYAAAPPLQQIVVMFLSHVFEASGSKLHYFMLPFAFNLIALREREEHDGERFSTQYLQDLTGRGWRKRSRPFSE
ncbi:MAG TPA: hypothetical protein PLD20_02065 [Blastocatellia bacterium]|nr:hypothetical protein [Blastocatellia bacterium]HMV87747.1 hypothetical protein [Blastocatellia bacterium]HMX24837.1 hypothetical protein [Blastocatellia bacterium]HMZ16722.1 hypothetical protein [Blastocatellia bacterium]HNG32967.1 hypothetical protein [Blastocatellia bacterium]